VLFNAYAGDLWRRFITYLPCHLARLAGVTVKQLHAQVRIRFVKVAEYQARGVVHFHAVIRLVDPGDDYWPRADLADHLERLGSDDDQALVFTSPMGAPLRHGNFYRRAWLPAVAKVNLPGIHFHDLRHAGNTLTADAGASLRELMDRMGHGSTRAALIYQHSSDERQRKLADAIGEAARAALLKTATASGTHVARKTGSQP
jgi:integrase